jgi:Transposase DNA-binding
MPELPVPDYPPLSLEFTAADFGDTRLALRFWRILDAIAEKPAASFPRSMGSDAKLEGFYRFINNCNVTPARILSPHFEQTCVRASAAETILALQDTSEVQYGGEQSRVGLGRVSGTQQGYFVHAALAVTADGLREPLGLLGLQTFSRSWRQRTAVEKKRRSKRGQASDSEALRWPALVDDIEQRTDGRFRIIHVMDREGDAFSLLGRLVADGRSFVVRSRHDRHVIADDSEQIQRLSETLSCTLPCVEREVHISRRAPQQLPAKERKHPAREARTARLQISATKMEVVATAFAGPHSPATIGLHCVHVREVDAPPGVEPIEWRLWTTLPIDTPEQILYIVDIYRARWLIEEFFKALKTGCSLQKRQQETGDSLYNVLALLAPVAWRLLLLRHLARNRPEAPASSVLTATQIEVLAAVRPNWPPSPTVRDALLAVAGLGGHIKNNGEPGWIVLGRGFEDLLRLELGWSLARKRCDRS